MKTAANSLLPAALGASYATRKTTVAHALRITRLDAQVFGFTEHDWDIVISGVTYLARPGLNVSKLAVAAGFSVGNLELHSLHDEAVFTKADVFGRVWRNAAFLIFRYDWARELDPYFSSVVALLHFDGADGSTTFTDVSPSPLGWSRTGNAQIDTAQSKWGGASLLLDGTGDALAPTATPSDQFRFPGDFTVEGWIRTTTTDASNHFVYDARSVWNSATGFSLTQFSSSLYLASGGANRIDIAGLTTGAQHHFAITRVGTTVRLFLGGVKAAVDWTSAADFSDGYAALGVNRTASLEYFNGWIDDVRITKGVGRYAANFTPPAMAFYDAQGVAVEKEPVLAGVVGEVEMRQRTFVAELRDLRQYFQQSIGDVTSKNCRYRLGSVSANAGGLCMKDISSAPYTMPFTVTHVTSNQVFRDSARAEAADWFGEGTVLWLTGNNAGLTEKVKTSTADGTFTLALPMWSAVQVGDTGTAVAGCRKRWEEDCKTKFSNLINFGGEKDAPGLDKMMKRPETSV